MSVILLTTGVPGCGKTYVRAARFLVDDFLINSSGVHYSNFPLNIDSIVRDVSKNHSSGFFSFLGRKSQNFSESSLRSRLKIIPDDVLQSWRSQESGPWDYFRGVDLKYAHIAIDEIHNFVSSSKRSDYIQKWDEFLGEIRHRGCTFEGLTQDIDQVDRVFTGRASLRLELIPAEDLRDPFFKIKMSDWYELKASFTGHYHKTVFEFEKRKQGRSWRVNNVRRFLITPDYFRYYNSYNASLSEKSDILSNNSVFSIDGSTCSDSIGQGESVDVLSDSQRSIQYEFQRRSRLSLFFWFVRRNFLSLFLRISLAIFVFWLCFCGGLNFFISVWLSASSKIAASNSSSSVSSVSDTDLPISNSPVDSSQVGSSNSMMNFVPNSSLSLKDFQEELQKRQLVFDSYKPAMFFDSSCWLRSGVKIVVGYKFNDRGPYDGKKVVEIDQNERFYCLDDGTCIHMY